ncbi:hypothetical protein CRG98_016986 [Punica granatum]|nr:hypothetical protein CRG98_016986 [Punica granatum]
MTRVGMHETRLDDHPEARRSRGYLEDCTVLLGPIAADLLGDEVKDKSTKDATLVVDVTQFGYFKVLGKGVLPEQQPIVVKAKLISKIA